jgi:hypothetical protein
MRGAEVRERAIERFRVQLLAALAKVLVCTGISLAVRRFAAWRGERV